MLVVRMGVFFFVELVYLSLYLLSFATVYVRVSVALLWHRYMRVLEPFFNGYDSNYSELRTRCRDILQQEDSLSEIVQLVGRDSLSEDQKVG